VIGCKYEERTDLKAIAKAENDYESRISHTFEDEAPDYIADQSGIATSEVRSERAAQSKPQAVRLQLSKIG
jgi:hypothetical protein